MKYHKYVLLIVTMILSSLAVSAKGKNKSSKRKKAIQYTEIRIVDEPVRNEIVTLEEIMDKEAQNANNGTREENQFQVVQDRHIVVVDADDYNNRQEPEEPILSAVEIPAEFPGGQTAMMKWIADNVKYPESLIGSGVTGRVVVKIVVEKDGSITNPRIVKGVNKDCDKETIRLMVTMPKWKPGMVNGHAVRSYYHLPVSFKDPSSSSY